MRLIGLFGIIPQIIVVIAVMMYVVKRSTAEAVLMTIGAIIGLITSIFYTVALPWLVDVYGSAWYEYLGLVGAVGTLGGLCFAIGLLLLIKNILRAKP